MTVGEKTKTISTPEYGSKPDSCKLDRPNELYEDSKRYVARPYEHYQQLQYHLINRYHPVQDYAPATESGKFRIAGIISSTPRDEVAEPDSISTS